MPPDFLDEFPTPLSSSYSCHRMNIMLSLCVGTAVSTKWLVSRDIQRECAAICDEAGGQRSHRRPVTLHFSVPARILFGLPRIGAQSRIRADWAGRDLPRDVHKLGLELNNPSQSVAHLPAAPSSSAPPDLRCVIALEHDGPTLTSAGSAARLPAVRSSPAPIRKPVRWPTSPDHTARAGSQVPHSRRRCGQPLLPPHGRPRVKCRCASALSTTMPSAATTTQPHQRCDTTVRHRPGHENSLEGVTDGRPPAL